MQMLWQCLICWWCYYLCSLYRFFLCVFFVVSSTDENCKAFLYPHITFLCDFTAKSYTYHITFFSLLLFTYACTYTLYYFKLIFLLIYSYFTFKTSFFLQILNHFFYHYEYFFFVCFAFWFFKFKYKAHLHIFKWKKKYRNKKKNKQQWKMLTNMLFWNYIFHAWTT